MKKIIQYGMVGVGCLLIALSFNFFVFQNGFISFGFDGLALLLHYLCNFNTWLSLFLLNMVVVFFSFLFVRSKLIFKYLFPSILIPIFIWLTEPLTLLINVDLPETLLTVIVGGFLSGCGYSLVYKEGFSAGTIFLVEEIIGKKSRFNSKIYSWIFDGILVIITAVFVGFEVAIYSLLMMCISKYMITKTRFGISDYKVFYVITSKSKEVKYYIIHDLRYELSVLDAKGGFTDQDTEIIFTVISTNDYYKMKTGIKIIDPNAFIAITDTYDVDFHFM